MSGRWMVTPGSLPAWSAPQPQSLQRRRREAGSPRPAGAYGRSVPETPTAAPSATAIGGSALPYGVMMRVDDQVAVAVRRPDQQVVVETFPVPPVVLSGSRIARLPFLRALLALRTSSVTGRRALSVMTRLLTGSSDSPPIGPLGQALALVVLGVGLVAQVALFRLAPLVLAKEMGLSGAPFILAEAAIRLTLLIGSLRLIALTPQARRLLAYHGAEHMAIAAREAGLPLTVDGARGCSRFHRRCGTSFLVGSSLISVLVYGAALAVTGAFSYPALILTRIVLAPVVSAIALEGQRVVSRGQGALARVLSAPGLATQRLTTAPPRPDELEVACISLEAALASRGEGATAKRAGGEPAAG